MPRAQVTRFQTHPTAEAPIERMLLTVEEAAAVLGVGRSLMFQLIAEGELHTVRVGRLRRIPPAALRAYVDSLSA